MSGVALALVSAVLFGGMSVALGFSMRRSRDALVGAFVTALERLRASARWSRSIGREWGGELWPFLLAGLLAPGGAQLLFVLGVREAGPARASVIAGAAPLIAVTIAVIALGEPAKLPLVAGAVLIVARRARAHRRARPPEHFRAIGLVYAFGCTVLFATRDNVVRHIAADTTVATAARRVGDDPLGDGAHLRRARGAAAQTGVRRHPAGGPPFVLPGSSGAPRTRSSSRRSTARGSRSSARSSRRSRSSPSCSRCCSSAAPSWSAATSCSAPRWSSPAAR